MEVETVEEVRASNSYVVEQEIWALQRTMDGTLYSLRKTYKNQLDANANAKVWQLNENTQKGVDSLVDVLRVL